MRKLLIAVVLLMLFAPLATAKDPVTVDVWVGFVVNPIGWGPAVDMEFGWFKRHNFKIGIAFPRVEDIGCAGGALFCSELQRTISVRTWEFNPPSTGLTVHKEHNWSVTGMWHVPLGRKK